MRHNKRHASKADTRVTTVRFDRHVYDALAAKAAAEGRSIAATLHDAAKLA